MNKQCCYCVSLDAVIEMKFCACVAEGNPIDGTTSEWRSGKEGLSS